MFLDFMKPDIWDGLVISVTLVGGALAILRLMQDRTHYQRHQKRSASRQVQGMIDLDTKH
ncbi:MAG: hypothetical protein JXA10_01185 [Anaerolineae bacterium]|nr:hypothetical protein [Anaerolineae bacterium]